MDLSWKLTGADQIVNKLSAFPSKLQKAAGKRSARLAMQEVKAAAVVSAGLFDDERTPGFRIWKNVYVQQSARQSRRVGGVVMRVGILGGAKQRGKVIYKPGGTKATGGLKGNPGGDTWYWRLLEFGTQNMPAQPFLRPALQDRAPAVEATLTEQLSREIDLIASQPASGSGRYQPRPGKGI